MENTVMGHVGTAIGIRVRHPKKLIAGFWFLPNQLPERLIHRCGNVISVFL